jgi:hypothetical protein
MAVEGTGAVAFCPKTVVTDTVNALSIVSLFFGLIILITAVAGAIYLFRIGPRFFGDDPGGRDPNLPGQFMMWGNGPNYIDFLRQKRGLRRKKRKE